MPTTLQDTLSRLTTFVSQNYTDIEVGPGSVINELLLKLAAAIQNEQYNIISDLSQGNSLKSIQEATEDTYSVIIDKIASNYNTYRSEGTNSIGKLKITIANRNDLNLSAGIIFVQPSLNLNYYLINDTRVSASPDEEIQEIQLHEENGTYYFIVDVAASEPGEEYQVTTGTVFSLGPSTYISSFVKAEAYGNFSTGKAIETDKQLLDKIKYSLSNSRVVSPVGIVNKFTSEFPGFQTLSVCGANDAEMNRSKYNALGIATFGKADVYVRSSLGPETLILNKTAEKIAPDTWEMVVANYEAPGFYNIKSIIPDLVNIDQAGTLEVQTINFGMSLYNDQRNNELNTATEARFTKYQTATVTFAYTDSPSLAVGSTANFIVHFNYQPNIASMQDLLLLDDQRLACSDYLVKAVIPCMVSLNINLIKKRATDTYDSLNLQNLKKDIFTYINSIPFGAELHASNIVDLCHNYNIKRVDLPIQMNGIILCPDNTSLSISDTDVLTIPQRLDKGITSKTTAYFIDYYRKVNGVVNPVDNIGLNIA